MFRTIIATLIAATTLATALIVMSMSTIAYASNGQGLAPGQGQTSEGDPAHNNPSNNQPPPGNNNEESLGNPGQCQKFLNGPAFDIDKELAHDICID
jgi:hypothetical protein